MPPNPKSHSQSAAPVAPEPVEFVPEKISINTMRQGRRRGQSDGGSSGGYNDNGDGNAGAGGSDGKNGDSGGQQQQLSTSQASQTSAISSSVVFHEQDCELFDEIDELYPHAHEGGKLVSDPNHSNTTYSDSTLSASAISSRSYTSSVMQSLQNSSLGERVPTDIESLVQSSYDGTLAQMIAGIEDRYKISSSTTTATSSQASKGNSSGKNNPVGNNGSKRDSIVGGKEISDMTLKEQQELLAPGRSDCNNMMVSSVDWSSLSKSCKRAKNAFRDVDSGQMVVKNMFVSHLSALTTVLTLYAKRYCTNNQENGEKRCSPEEIKARTTEAKRALRFAMACLAPPRMEEDSGGGEEPESEAQDEIEKYRLARQYRQELQEAAVNGFASQASSPTACGDGEMDPTNNSSRPDLGLQIPLVQIIFSSRPWNAGGGDDNQFASNGDSDKNCAAIISSIEKEKRTVRTLAARLMCNLVTDNPLAAEIVLRDVPFSPTPDEVESRMARSIMESRERGNGDMVSHQDEVVYWSDLVAATAKVQGADASGNGKGKLADDSKDREVLAAVAAALHNLLTSLEARDSLLKLDGEMKHQENDKHHREASCRDSAGSGSCSTINEKEVEHQTINPIDVGFEIASNGPLMNSLLRNILPAKAVLLQSQLEKERMEQSGPKFKPPTSAADDMSDSATEWISLVLERLASRGLLSHMLRSAGGMTPGSVTPEQVVLVSCIRQAVDDFHSARNLNGETGGFGRRRLSIAAKAAGMTMATRPHPLWGRADVGEAGRVIPGRDSRTAVPVLLSLANEAEEIRLRANELRENKSNELYEGELSCTVHVIDDICDILAQTLGRHAPTSIDGTDSTRNSHCFLGDAREVIGRETSLISSCCKDLGRLLDIALARNSGRKARELTLSAQDQQTAIVMVRLIGNFVYQCRYNQDLLRITPVPALEIANVTPTPSESAGANANSDTGAPIERTGLHVILSATSLSVACFTLREWCIVAIRNAIEGNDANAETVRRLEANQVLDDTPELRRAGVKVDMDAQGKVHVKRREQ